MHAHKDRNTSLSKPAEKMGAYWHTRISDITEGTVEKISVACPVWKPLEIASDRWLRPRNGASMPRLEPRPPRDLNFSSQKGYRLGYRDDTVGVLAVEG